MSVFVAQQVRFPYFFDVLEHLRSEFFGTGCVIRFEVHTNCLKHFDPGASRHVDSEVNGRDSIEAKNFGSCLEYDRFHDCPKNANLSNDPHMFGREFIDAPYQRNWRSRDFFSHGIFPR